MLLTRIHTLSIVTMCLLPPFLFLFCIHLQFLFLFPRLIPTPDFLLPATLQQAHTDLEALAQTRAGGGGVFEWVDSPLVRAVRDGRWLLVDNVNFCRSSTFEFYFTRSSEFIFIYMVNSFFFLTCLICSCDF